MLLRLFTVPVLMILVGVPTLASAETGGCFFSDRQAISPDIADAQTQALAQSFLERAKADDAKGWHKQGELFYRGALGERDYARAMVCFQTALTKGYAPAAYNLGLSQMRAGANEAALGSLMAAQSAGVAKAEVQIAFGHAQQKFGAASDPALGFQMLQKFAETGNQRAQYLRAEAKSTGTGVRLNAKDGFSDMLALAKAGYPPAMNRVGRAFTFGIGTNADLEAARGWYEQAVASGYVKAELGLANAHARARDYDAALGAYDRALKADVDTAEFELARAHSEGRFGRKSKYVDGWRTLTRLSNDGHLRASQTIIAKLGTGSGRRANVPFLVQQLTAAAQAGDGRSAAALARFFRERPDLVSGARQKRRSILRDFAGDMNPSDLIKEKVRDAVARAPANAWREMYNVVKPASGDVFTAGMLEIRRVGRNAYVFALQHELRGIGMRTTKPSGVFDRSTLRASFEICKTLEAIKKCKTAPLGFDTVRAVAEYLASRR